MIQPANLTANNSICRYYNIPYNAECRKWWYIKPFIGRDSLWIEGFVRRRYARGCWYGWWAMIGQSVAKHVFGKMFGGMSTFVNGLCLCLVFTKVHASLWPNETRCPAEAFTAASSNSLKGDNVVGTSENGTNECPCLKRACLPMCRSTIFQSRKANTSGVNFPTVHDPATLESRRAGIRIEDFHVFTWDPCRGGQKYKLEPEDYKFLANGSIYLTDAGNVINFTNYCFGVVGGDTYSVVLCASEAFNEAADTAQDQPNVVYPIGMILSVPFLVVTFVVYSVIPELRNMHGATLRGYVASLIVAYTVLSFVQITPPNEITDSQCISMAFVIYFSLLATFFWLNVMCFDIWCTFRGCRSLQANVKEREKRTFIIYSIYVWGSAMFLTGVCLIMDFVPSKPNNYIRPAFGDRGCWFATDDAQALYFYVPMGVTVICNVCLFISTAIKIIQHKKDTDHHLKGMDSRRHDDNKQWFNLYLKLFIVMGVSWSMEIISGLCKDAPPYVWYITDIANTLQGPLIFIIFIWKDKIKRLLLKRMGCQGISFRSGNAPRSGGHSSGSKTPTTTIAMTPL